jgi:hypothetical protein
MIGVEANESAVDDGSDHTASVQRSSTVPTGTSLNESQVGAGFLNVSDIGLTDTELTEATIEIDLDGLEQQTVNTFDNSSLRILKSSDGEQRYHPVETTYNDDTHTVTATVDGFSQFSVAGTDSTKPSITSTDVDPGRTVKPSNGPVNVSYEFTDAETGINLSETTLTSSVGASRNTTKIMANSAWIKIDQLTDGETITVKLNVTDNAGNSHTATETISVETSSENDENDDDGGSGGGGGGGGVGGAGGGGGGGQTDQGPPSIAEIKTTLSSFVTPTTTAQQKLKNAETSSQGMTVAPTETQVVDTITFETEGLSGSVEITEYADPPAVIRERVSRSISETDAIDAGGEDGNAEGIDVVSLTNIKPTAEQAEESSATVQLQVAKSAVENPEQLSVIKEFYDFGAQKTRWKRLDTSVENTGDDTVTISAQVEDFSLFAVTEIQQQQSAGDEVQQQDGDQQGSDGPPMGLLAAGVLLVVGLAIAVVYRRRERL